MRTGKRLRYLLAGCELAFMVRLGLRIILIYMNSYCSRTSKKTILTQLYELTLTYV